MRYGGAGAGSGRPTGQQRGQRAETVDAVLATLVTLAEIGAAPAPMLVSPRPDRSHVKTFDGLFAELTERARTRPAGSGTVALLDQGVHAIGKKIVEEAAGSMDGRRIRGVRTDG